MAWLSLRSLPVFVRLCLRLCLYISLSVFFVYAFVSPSLSSSLSFYFFVCLFVYAFVSVCIVACLCLYPWSVLSDLFFFVCFLSFVSWSFALMCLYLFLYVMSKICKPILNGQNRSQYKSVFSYLCLSSSFAGFISVWSVLICPCVLQRRQVGENIYKNIRDSIRLNLVGV